MDKIKFSHKYAKMPDDTSNTRLLEVLKTDYKELSPAFTVYDTEWNNGYYELPRTDLIVLILISYIPNAIGSHNEHLWTTIRRWTQEKERYYKSIRGKAVEIIIQDER